MQYAEYGPGGHYGSWHTDAELGDADPEDARCATLTMATLTMATLTMATLTMVIPTITERDATALALLL